MAYIGVEWTVIKLHLVLLKRATLFTDEAQHCQALPARIQTRAADAQGLIGHLWEQAK